MRNVPLVFGLEISPRIEKDWISRIVFGPEKSSSVLRNARQLCELTESYTRRVRTNRFQSPSGHLILEHPFQSRRFIIAFFRFTQAIMASQPGGGFINFSLDHITKTWIGRLKAAELVLTLLAGACGSSVYSYAYCNCASKFGFFDFVAWTAFINALIDMIIHLLGLWERLLWIFRHPAVFSVLCLMAVVGFLIGSSLAASCAKDSCVTSRSTAGAAAFFGFVCLAVFAVECFLHFKAYRSMQSEAQQQSSGEAKPPDYIEPPPSRVVWMVFSRKLYSSCSNLTVLHVHIIDCFFSKGKRTCWRLNRLPRQREERTENRKERTNYINSSPHQISFNPIREHDKLHYNVVCGRSVTFHASKE